MSVVLDAGALLAVERGDRRIAALLKMELAAGRSPRTHGGVIGQVWRGDAGRQARLAKALQGVEVVAIDDALGRRIGILLGRSGRTDVIDAGVVLVADEGDEVFTGDRADLRELAAAAGRNLDLVEV
ncbi:MAG TPA: hypothetical protein VFM06_11525 [Candidatus Limnocylindria bacterium]|nr:hypothetical protein [Candidatus Limnocylindria bacterium]